MDRTVEGLRITIEAGVATLTIDRPDVRNAMTYSTNGNLKSIAQGETFGDVDKSCSGLVELPTEERHGLVWVVDSPDADIDVAEWLGTRMDESLSSFELDQYVCDRVGNFDEPINWKVLMDAFLDAYHISSTHSGTVAPSTIASRKL